MSKLMNETLSDRQGKLFVCMTGAHRSGTSMLARLLHHCGVDLGPERDLMPPAADNEEGFWENLKFVKMNDEILSQFGGRWDVPPTIDTGTPASRRLARLVTKARTLINSFSGSRAWGWKDPRNCLTLPFWNRVIPALKVVVIVRSPLEVARSLQTRNGVSIAYGLKLWMAYNERLVRDIEGNQAVITRYDAFFQQPERELTRILEFLGMPAANMANVTSVISRNHRHHHAPVVSGAEHELPADVLHLYRAMTFDGVRSTNDELKRVASVTGERRRSYDKRAAWASQARFC